MLGDMNWSRWSAFFSLAGLAVFIPAALVPAMLVANAIDGPRWYSVWSGIREFYRSGEFFLAGLIACFSLAFPLVKFSLGLLCSAGRRFMSPGRRKAIVTLTSWTAKYSMLDVLVIAMLILLVKVNEYVRILPSLGLYLFSAAILLSALAGAALNRALAAETRPPASAGDPKAWLRPPAWIVMLVVSVALTVWGAQQVMKHRSGTVDSVSLTRLTHRGELRRSVEKTLALKELAKKEHDFFSKDTVRRLMEFGQAVTTDAGWKDPEAWVSIETTSGRILDTNRIKPVDLDARDLTLTFSLPEPVARGEIALVRLISSIEWVKVIEAPIEEEVIRRADDPFRDWTRTWHGRIFSLRLNGQSAPELQRSLIQTALGVLASLWCVAALLVPGGAGRGIQVPSKRPSDS